MNGRRGQDVCLSSLTSGWWSSGFRDGLGGLPGVGKKMLHIVIGIVGFVGIPDSGEKIALAGDGTSLHVYAIDEAVFDLRGAPVAAPYESGALRELSKECEIAFPARLAAD